MTGPKEEEPVTEAPSDSAMEYMQSDHRRLDAIMCQCKELVSSGDLRGAADQFERFREGLMRHIKIEEGLLFPAFETATGTPRQGGPTGVMRIEHEEIIRLLGLMRTVFESETPAVIEFETLCSQLESNLHEHNLKEEQIIYPGTDRALSPEALHELIGKIRAF